MLTSGHDQFNVSELLGELQKFPKVSSIFMLHIDLEVGRKFGLGVKLFSCQCVVFLKSWPTRKSINIFHTFIISIF